MSIERRRAHIRDAAFWLAVASSTVVGLVFFLSMLGSLMGAPPQQAWFTMLVGLGLAMAVLFALAGVVAAHAARHEDGAGRRAKSALLAGYCILGSMAVMAVLATLTLIAIPPQ